jgi:hypothetical protein
VRDARGVANLIRLQHRAPSLRTYEIPVEHGGGEAHLLGRVTRDGKTGTAGVRVVKAMLPTTITLCARGTDGDTSEPLDEAVLRAPQIDAARKAGLITVLLLPSGPASDVVERDAPTVPDEAPLPAALTSTPIPLTTSKKPAASAKPEEK